MTEDMLDYLKRESIIFEQEIERAIPRNKKPWEVYGIVWEHLDLGGKRLRPILCKLSCEAVGGDGKKAIPAGTAIEMFHNFTLIHDDIEDSSEMRRGKPCIYKRYGVPLAINAGDGLFMMVTQETLNLELPPEQIIEVQRVLFNAFSKVLEGQAIELNWYRLNNFNITEKEYFDMVSGKTGALISASCEVGALVGGAHGDKRGALAEFGMDIGLAFQIQDDVLNLVGAEEKYGKEIGGDISEGKRSLITIYALAHANPADKKELIRILGARTKDKALIEKAIQICKKTGAIDYASKRAKELVDEAKRKLHALPDNEARRRLAQLADFFVYREV